ncbi:MAG: glycosyltransferase family 4 protein [Parafilimonas sp.]
MPVGRSTEHVATAQEDPGATSAAGRRLYVVIPGDLDTRSGGYGYDRRIIAGLRQRGWTVTVLRLGDSFPMPTPGARAHAAETLAAIPDGSTVLFDGLALGALPEEVERAASRLTVVALVHHPLAAETGIDPAAASALAVSERRALAAARWVAVTSAPTAARLVADYGVAVDRMTVIEPGTDPAPLARGSGIDHQPSTLGHQPSVVSLLCVATLTPRKGYPLLIAALAAIPPRNWRLTCAGSLDRDPAVAARVRAQLGEAGLEHRVSLVGDLDQAALAAEYDRADLFVLPTLYEGYGMAVAQAVARGLPVISTDTGAIRDLVGDGGIVVGPGDKTALADALSRAIGDPVLRATLRTNAQVRRDHLPGWDAAVAAMARMLALQAVR